MSYFQKTFQREENSPDGQLDFEEFVHYLQDYEKDLKLVVKSIDRKNAGTCTLSLFVRSSYTLSNFTYNLLVCFSGRVDLKEFMQSLRDLGVHISAQHAENALKR